MWSEKSNNILCGRKKVITTKSGLKKTNKTNNKEKQRKNDCQKIKKKNKNKK